MQQAAARYDLITDFYLGVVGTDASDPAVAALLGLLGDVAGCGSWISPAGMAGTPGNSPRLAAG